MENKKNEVVRITKTKLKRLMVASALAGTILTTAISGAIEIAKKGHQRNQGAEYIVSQIEASGILPDGFSSRMYDSGNIYFNYVDASGIAQITKDSEALVDDIFEDGLGVGFTAEQMEIYFQKEHGWTEHYEGVTKETMNEAKEAAYLEMLQMNSKGVSR